MTDRITMFKEIPGAYQALTSLENAVKEAQINELTLELIKIRASQINGCAYCLDMHTKDARSLGETEQRIYALNAWRETPYFSPAERAVLALSEAVTLISQHHVPDDVYDEVAEHFDSKQVGAIIMAAISINAWNRIAISTKMMPK